MEETPTETQQLFELPEFEGIQPVGVITSLTGSGQRITRPLSLDHRVILVIEAEVVNVNHKTTKDGVKRVHTLSVKDLWEVEGKDGIKLLSSMRLKAKKADDQRSGKAALPGIDEQVHTDHGLTLDENGVALTPEEANEARGLIDDGEEPGVLIFSDGSRALWPEDYAALPDYSTPYCGDFLRNPNNESTEDLQVVKILDIATGETLEVWSPEMEKERLLEEEAKAKKAEDAKAKKKPSKKKPAKVIVDEITPALEADAKAPALPDEVDA